MVHGITLSKEGFHSLWGRGTIASHVVLLAKPQTFMNRSGQAVRALLSYFRLSLQALTVVHDDLDLPFGRIKIVPGGGPGGHRGVESIHGSLASSRYVRVKVGIDRPRFGEPIEDYVLGPWYSDQDGQVPEVVEAAAEAVTAVFTEGLEKAMSIVNAGHAPYG
jgi:PTH1 family peptidyl-tRNA hydrolase